MFEQSSFNSPHNNYGTAGIQPTTVTTNSVKQTESVASKPWGQVSYWKIGKSELEPCDYNVATIGRIELRASTKHSITFNITQANQLALLFNTIKALDIVYEFGRKQLVNETHKMLDNLLYINQSQQS